MDAIVTLSLLLLPGLILLYLLKRQVDKLDNTDGKRIMDLLMVGFIMNYSENMWNFISRESYQALSTAGSLIFLYGFALLLYKSFKQGLMESMRG
jgi:hypothetical protein